VALAIVEWPLTAAVILITKGGNGQTPAANFSGP